MCPSDPTKTRREVFYSSIPHIQEIRLLPIMCILMVYREIDGAVDVEGTQITTNVPFYQYGLYVGPALNVVGGIRVAVLTGATKVVRILVTTKYKSVTDGGGINIRRHVQRGLRVPPQMV